MTTLIITLAIVVFLLWLGGTTTPHRSRLDNRTRSAVYRKYGGKRCVVCGTTHNIQIDHRIPRSRGGSDHLSNLQPMCAFHNRLKSNAMPGQPWVGRPYPRYRRTR